MTAPLLPWPCWGCIWGFTAASPGEWRVRKSHLVISMDVGGPAVKVPKTRNIPWCMFPKVPWEAGLGLRPVSMCPPSPPPSAFSGESSACSASQNLPVSLPVPEPDQVNGIYIQAKSFQPPRLFLSSSTRCQLMVNLQEFSSWQTQSPSTFSFTSWLKKNQEGHLVSGELSVADRTSAHFADARPVQGQLQQQL